MKKLLLFFIFMFPLSFIIDHKLAEFFAVHRIESLTYFLNIITYAGTLIFVTIISTSLLLIYKEKRKRIPYIWLTIAIVSIIVELLKLLIVRPRPELIGNYSVKGSSFPSGHSALIFSPVAMLSKEFPKFKIFIVSFALLVAFSRLYLGVHYLSDIIAGSLLGYLIGYLVPKIENKIVPTIKKQRSVRFK